MCQAIGMEEMLAVGSIGEAMAAADAPGATCAPIRQFIEANRAKYVTREGKLVIDDLEIRLTLKSVDRYTSIWRTYVYHGAAYAVERALTGLAMKRNRWN